MILKILPKPPKCQEVKIQTGTVLTSLTRKKGFQIILPSGDALQFVLVSSQSDKMQTGHYQKRRRATLLSCQLPPLRAEGSKKWQKTLLFNHKTTVQVHNCTKAILKCV